MEFLKTGLLGRQEAAVAARCADEVRASGVGLELSTSWFLALLLPVVLVLIALSIASAPLAAAEGSFGDEDLENLEWLELAPAREGAAAVKVPAAVVPVYVRYLGYGLEGSSAGEDADEALIPPGGTAASAELARLRSIPNLERLGAWLARSFRLEAEDGLSLARAELLGWVGQQRYLVQRELKSDLGPVMDWQACACIDRLLPSEMLLRSSGEREWRQLVRHHQRRGQQLSRPLVARWSAALDRLGLDDPAALDRLVDLAQEVQQVATEPWDVYADLPRSRYGFLHREQVLNRHLQRYPMEPALLAHRALYSQDAYERIALWELARASMGDQRHDALAIRWAAQHALALAVVGLVDEAEDVLLPFWASRGTSLGSSAAAVDGLPEGWTDALSGRSGSRDSSSFTVGALPVRLSEADLRLDVSALLMAWGQPLEAQALLATVDPPAEKRLDIVLDSHRDRGAYPRYQLLQQGLKASSGASEELAAQSKDDEAEFFSLLMTWAEGVPTPHRTVLWDLVLADVAEEEGYSTYRRFFLGRSAAIASLEPHDPTEELRGIPQLAYRQQVARRSEALFGAARDDAEDRLTQARLTPGFAVVLQPSVLRRQSPSFAELLPEGLRVLGVEGREDESQAFEEISPSGQPAFGPLAESLPEGFWIESDGAVDGDETAVLATGLNEYGSSSLHLLRSPDGGRSWPQRNDLGVVMGYGFQLAGARGHQLWGDRLELVVERSGRWSDWPLPVEVAVPAEEGDPTSALFRLEIELAALERDQDGDGWSDLEERLLGLNSELADSDGDGLKDRQDPFPRSVTTGFSTEGEVFAAAQREVAGSPLHSYGDGDRRGPAVRAFDSQGEEPRPLLHPGLAFGLGGALHAVADFQHPEAMVAAGLDPQLHVSDVVHLVAVSHDGQQAQVLTGWARTIAEVVRLEREPGEAWTVVDGMAGRSDVRYPLGRRAEELARGLRQGLPIGE